MNHPAVPINHEVAGAEHHCFTTRRCFAHPAYSVSLDTKTAEALADMVPLLCCGEEAAVVGFDRLARAGGLDLEVRRTLRQIADDERRHDAILRGLRAALPVRTLDRAVQQRARHFHLSLPRGGTVLHLARIAGLDAAVCTILSRLLRPGAAISRDDGVRAVLTHIRQDETRHVMVSRRIALAAADRQAVRNAAADARRALAELLTCAADAFEALGVDPAKLRSDIERLPDGLLPQ
jgi:hypothetical protein